MTLHPFNYRKVLLTDGDFYYLVYRDDDYLGEVHPVRGGWVFYDKERQIQAASNTRESASALGVENE